MAGCHWEGLEPEVDCELVSSSWLFNDTKIHKAVKKISWSIAFKINQLQLSWTIAVFRSPAGPFNSDFM